MQGERSCQTTMLLEKVSLSLVPSDIRRQTPLLQRQMPCWLLGQLLHQYYWIKGTIESVDPSKLAATCGYLNQFRH